MSINPSGLVPENYNAYIKFYYTSLEPNLAQSNAMQSIGGYVSTSLAYPETTLANTIGLYDTSFTLNTPTSGNWDDWKNVTYINIGSEVMKVSPITNGNINIINRGYNGIVNMHIASDIAMAMKDDKLFNNVLNTGHKQYRCLVVKNISDEKIFYDVFSYINQNSRNVKDVVKIAVEIPKYQQMSKTSSSWTSISLTDDSLIGEYADNYFKDSYIRINSGPNNAQGRTVNSFDSSSGQFIFYNSLPIEYDSDYSRRVSYQIDPAPAQRIKSGIVAPITGSGRTSSFSKADKYYPININILGSLKGQNLYPNEIFYLWFERTLKKGSNLFEKNNIIPGVLYSSIE